VVLIERIVLSKTGLTLTGNRVPIGSIAPCQNPDDIIQFQGGRQVGRWSEPSSLALHRTILPKHQ
jgi:hypothetical protein